MKRRASSPYGHHQAPARSYTSPSLSCAVAVPPGGVVCSKIRTTQQKCTFLFPICKCFMSKVRSLRVVHNKVATLHAIIRYFIMKIRMPHGASSSSNHKEIGGYICDLELFFFLIRWVLWCLKWPLGSKDDSCAVWSPVSKSLGRCGLPKVAVCGRAPRTPRHVRLGQCFRCK